ncbi:hypothetical protein HK098_000772 [Nowakowskiella sp. JEL0407]|nr:hypothetical protein HK098_000772 [Nowakowskiella sp. JEL0407]
MSGATFWMCSNAGVDLTFQSSVMEFISKIGQMVLRARVGLEHQNAQGTTEYYNPLNDLHELLDRPEFWRSGVPINIDIFLANSRILMERWVVSFEHTEKSHHADMTDFILLVQSLYSHIRLMPIHAHLADQTITKADLRYSIVTADGYPISPIDEFQNEVFTTGFDLTAKLKVYKFRTAVATFGKLHLSVVYDSATTNLISRTFTPVTQQVIPLSLNFSDQTAPIVVSDSTQLPPTNGLGSPLPSPTLSKRVLHLTHLKESRDSSPSSNNNSPTRSRSLLSSFKSTYSDSYFATSPLDEEEDTFIPGESDPLPIPKLSRKSSSNLRISIPGSHAHVPQTSPHPLYVSRSPVRSRRSSFGEMLSHSSGNRRRESVSSELFGSLVGSYEQSILSGRMSTLPSRPIVFIAEIGVIGFGKCKPQLKCPPHINLSFPAYFYELLDEKSIGSPYVGVVDLETLSGYMVVNGDNSDVTSMNNDEFESVLRQRQTEAEEFKKKWPGGYRLPFRGQLQIIIKNPSKTALKVFLVPYDFRDMPANSKTFLRQKSYSTPSLTTPAFPGSLSPTRKCSSGSDAKSPSNDRLRYAIHLQFVCNAKKRLFLSKNIRVVFSPRALESDEKLRTVCEGPEDPKYTMIIGSQPSHSPAAMSISSLSIEPQVNTHVLPQNPLHSFTTYSLEDSQHELSSHASHGMAVDDFPPQWPKSANSQKHNWFYGLENNQEEVLTPSMAPNESATVSGNTSLSISETSFSVTIAQTDNLSLSAKLPSILKSIPQISHNQPSLFPRHHINMKPPLPPSNKSNLNANRPPKFAVPRKRYPSGFSEDNTGHNWINDNSSSASMMANVGDEDQATSDVINGAISHLTTGLHRWKLDNSNEME